VGLRWGRACLAESACGVEDGVTAGLGVGILDAEHGEVGRCTRSSRAGYAARDVDKCHEDCEEEQSEGCQSNEHDADPAGHRRHVTVKPTLDSVQPTDCSVEGHPTNDYGQKPDRYGCQRRTEARRTRRSPRTDKHDDEGCSDAAHLDHKRPRAGEERVRRVQLLWANVCERDAETKSEDQVGPLPRTAVVGLRRALPTPTRSRGRPRSQFPGSSSPATPTRRRWLPRRQIQQLRRRSRRSCRRW
jgi:hypothetical protein